MIRCPICRKLGWWLSAIYGYRCPECSRRRGDAFIPGVQYANASRTPLAFRDALLAMARTSQQAFACSSPEDDWLDDQRSEWDEFCDNDRIANP